MRRQSKGYEIDMCNGTLANKILLFALPLMASSLLQLLFNAADVAVSYTHLEGQRGRRRWGSKVTVRPSSRA